MQRIEKIVMKYFDATFSNKIRCFSMCIVQIDSYRVIENKKIGPNLDDDSCGSY